MDETPVTNRQFCAFVEATGHVTFAEIPPDPEEYPGALPHMLRAGSLMFNPPSLATASYAASSTVKYAGRCAAWGRRRGVAWKVELTTRRE